MQTLEKNQVRLQALREKTEDKLRERLGKFDEKLKEMLKRVEAYRFIGVSSFLLTLTTYARVPEPLAVPKTYLYLKPDTGTNTYSGNREIRIDSSFFVTMKRPKETEFRT